MVMASLLFPLNARRVKWSTEVEQSWDVTEEKSASGKRRALTYQTLPGWQFTMTFPALSSEERDKLLAFYSRVKGSLIPFFYKDAESYLCENVVLPKNTDGSYQLTANMHGQQEPVEYADNIKVYIDGVLQGDSSYNLDRGAIVFKVAPAEGAKVTASYEYWWKVHFSKTSIKPKQKYKNLFECSVVLEVVR